MVSYNPMRSTIRALSFDAELGFFLRHLADLEQHSSVVFRCRFDIGRTLGQVYQPFSDLSSLRADVSHVLRATFDRV